MIDHIFESVRKTFYHKVEKVQSNISFADYIVKQQLATPTVSIGISPESYESFVEALTSNKDLIVKKNNIRFELSDEENNLFTFQGLKLTHEGAVVAYFAYNIDLGIMYNLLFNTGTKQFFSQSLFQNSYSPITCLSLLEKISVFEGIGASEEEAPQALAQLFGNFTRMKYTHEKFVDEKYIDASNLRSLTNILKLDSFTPSAMCPGRSRFSVIPLIAKSKNTYSFTDAGLGIRKIVEQSEGIVIDTHCGSYKHVGYYTYVKGAGFKVRYFKNMPEQG